MNRILIVEDEREMAGLLRQGLSELGYTCNTASNGYEGLVAAPEYELLLVDVMMPVMNGFDMVEKLREQGHSMPVIFLTAKDTTKDVVRGLGAGADDYLIKPFKFEELVARVKAALRRARDSSQTLVWDDLAMDCSKRTVWRGGIELYLSMTEFSLLEVFMRQPGAVLSKETLLKKVWRDDGHRDENIVETYVTYLRRKTEVRCLPRLIHTVRGRGYVLALAQIEP